MGLRNISLLAVVWFALFVGSNAEEQVPEQERRPIKTFNTIYGETVDCIDIYKQPAFDHPLLKNHKLQKEPTFSLDATKHRQRAQYKQIERSHDLDGCPDGTIPILRTTKGDQMRAKLPEQTRPQIYHPQTAESPGDNFAYLTVHAFDEGLFGAKAFLVNYIPKCTNGQSSGAQIRINSENTTSTIQAGWRVDPDLYKDDQSHLFVYWKVGGQGCFDLQCSGFVQVDKSVILGGVLVNSSVYEGLQFEIHLSIKQDVDTKNWWFIVEKNEVDISVGYWPADLIPQLMSGANTMQYGGATHAANGMPSPPMGSGYFPDKSYSHACCIRQIHYLDGSQAWVVPEKWRTADESTSKNCYGTALNNEDQFMGYTLLFGGPGGANCGP